MSTLGKVLAVLNALAAIGFVCLAAADWGKRQEWSYAVLRQELALDGLPLDENERTPDGTLAVDVLSDETMQELFRPVGGIAPQLKPADKTQLAEVRRAKDRLLNEINALPDDAAKRKRLTTIVPSLATTLGQRDKFAEQVQKDSIENILSDEGPLGEAFARPFDTTMEPGRRRQAVAHVLLNTSDPKSNDYQRALVTVGLRAFAGEGDRQAIALRDMTHRARLALDQQAGAFEADYNRVVADLRYLADKLADRQTKLAEYQDLATRHRELLTKRQADVAELRTQIEEARKGTATVLAELATEQQKLFDAQRAVATGVARNLELEQQIRQQERPRSEGK